MKQYTIEVSEPVYQLLNQQAVIEDRSLDNILERLLILAPLFVSEAKKPAPREALSAVQRLTTLFADVEIEDLEEALDDPMLTLANSDLDLGLI